MKRLLFIWILPLVLLWGCRRSVKDQLYVAHPVIMVWTDAPGFAAEEIEHLVTYPIEKALNGLRGVEKISSLSLKEKSLVRVDFEPDIDADVALMQVRQAVEKSVEDMPADVDPGVYRLDYGSLDPFGFLILEGDMPYDAFDKILTGALRDSVNVIPGLWGTFPNPNPPQIQINVDLQRMVAMGIKPDELEKGISEGAVESIEDLQEVIVLSEGKNAVYLKDIATLEMKREDPKFIWYRGNRPVMAVPLFYSDGANEEEVFAVVKEKMTAWKDMMPEVAKLSFWDVRSGYARLGLQTAEEDMERATDLTKKMLHTVHEVTKTPVDSMLALIGLDDKLLAAGFVPNLIPGEGSVFLPKSVIYDRELRNKLFLSIGGNHWSYRAFGTEDPRDNEVWIEFTGEDIPEVYNTAERFNSEIRDWSEILSRRIYGMEVAREVLFNPNREKMARFGMPVAEVLKFLNPQKIVPMSDKFLVRTPRLPEVILHYNPEYEREVELIEYGVITPDGQLVSLAAFMDMELKYVPMTICRRNLRRAIYLQLLTHPDDRPLVESELKKRIAEMKLPEGNAISLTRPSFY